MKKVLFVLFALVMLSSFCFAAAPKPSQKVILFYKVSEEIIKWQNANGDLTAGKKEFEKELVNNYSKRFIVQGIERIPLTPVLTPTEYFKKVKPGQLPFIIRMEVRGRARSAMYSRQRSGTQIERNIQLFETIPSVEDNDFYDYFYDLRPYIPERVETGSGVSAAQTDPRKNNKNTVISLIRDACEFNDAIDKSAAPIAYAKERNRFTGNFKQVDLDREKNNAEADVRIEKFKVWCNADAMRKFFLYPLDTENDNDYIISYINHLIRVGIYQE